MRRSLLPIGFLGVLGVLGACSSKDDDASSRHGLGGASSTDGGLIFASGGGGTTGAGASAGAGTGTTTDGGGSIGPNGCPAAATASGCVGEMYVGENIPLDIYIMFDQSGSMLNVEEGGVTRMDAVRSAVGQFLNAPESSGLSVGIGYFGQQPIGQTTCDPAVYESADVAVGLLPGNSQAIIDSLATREPTGETPSGAAIRGACTYGKQWKTDHPGREVVILLVTDGEPKAPVTCGDMGAGPCCPTLADAVTAAGDCRSGTPGLKTYVLGVGPFLDNLGEIATAGGSDHAYLVSGGDVSQQVLDALNAIRAAAQIPCELHIPPPPDGENLDYDLVNIVYTTDTCETKTIEYRVASTSCDGATGGWFYDDVSAPQKVQLCGKTCDDVSIPGGQLMFSVGCARPPPR